MKNTITLDKRLLSLIYTFFVIIFLYFIVPSSGGTIIWITFIGLLGFYYSLYIKSCVIFSSVFVCCLFIAFTKNFSFNLFIMCLIFISLIPFPYYINIKLKKIKTILSSKKNVLKNQYTSVFSEYQESIKLKKEYEYDMQRISKLYDLDDLLSNITLKKDYADLILDFFSQSYGVFGGAILEKVPSGWEKISVFGILQGNDLASFMELTSLVNNGTSSCYVIDNKEFSKQYFSVLYFPMFVENSILGCIFIVVKKDLESRYIKDGSIFVSHFSLGLKRINYFEEIKQKLRFDPLTGVLLKFYFLETVKIEIQKSKYFCILMLDLDNFKDINDKYGHLVGDKILAEISKIILSILGNNSLVGRYGGDEFIIFIPDLTEKETILIVNKINKSLNNKFFEENNEKFNITASIGVSYNSKSNLELNTIVNKADAALYKAKKNGKNTSVFYKEL
ncbi:MAG: GGDEF domain-containing protein [Endomicrobium sp.]|nr:GGDEF domain-containing protein [Endomicrobium sp.]